MKQLTPKVLWLAVIVAQAACATEREPFQSEPCERYSGRCAAVQRQLLVPRADTVESADHIRFQQRR